MIYDEYYIVGCVNGSAQIRPRGDSTTKELIVKLERSFNQLPSTVYKSGENGLINDLYESWLGGRQTDKAKAMLHTTYHAIPKNNLTLNIKW